MTRATIAGGAIGTIVVLLIFLNGRQRPEYVPWSDVEQVQFDRPSQMYLPTSHR